MKIGGYDKRFINLVQTVSLVFNSISCVLFIITTVLRYRLSLDLLISRKKTLTVTNLWSFYWGYLTFEIIFSLLHPNWFVEDLVFKTYFPNEGIEIILEVNDVLTLIVLFRIYYVFRFLLYVFNFQNGRSQRVNKMLGVNPSPGLTLRCLMQSNPFVVIVFVTVMVIMKYAYLLRIIEGPIGFYNYNKITTKQTFYNYLTSLWNILVTLTTVGYGDTFPDSTLGRLTDLFASVSGNLLLTVLMVFVQLILHLSPSENLTFMFIEKMKDKEKTNQIGALYFLSCLRVIKKKNEYISLLRGENPDPKAVKKIKKEMKVLFIEKIKCQKVYKAQLNEFKSNWEHFEMKDTIRKRVTVIEDYIRSIRDKQAELKLQLKNMVKRREHEVIKKQKVLYTAIKQSLK